MNIEFLNLISFWIQVRSILFQFMNWEMILHIARAMGQYIQMEYNEEASGRLEFVRIRLNWNVAHPLKFHRHFQSTLGANKIFKFHYERLRDFCEACGMLSHDIGAYVINNEGIRPDDGDDDSGNDNDEEDVVHNQGVIIEEVNEDEAKAEEDQPEE